MRLLFISSTGYGLSIASHLSSEGHATTFVIRKSSDIGKGVVDQKTSLGTLQDIIDSFPSDAVVLDEYTDNGRILDHLRQSGRKVIGPSVWSELVCTDPNYEQDLIRATGWNQKPLGQGVNLYITAWYNGAHYICSYVSLVYKRLMSSGAGPDVDFSGAVANFYQPTEKILTTFLNPLEKVLRRVSHKGCVHLHAMVHGDEYMVKRIIPSFSYPLTLLLFENSKTSVSDILMKLFDENSKDIKPLEQWASMSQISIPPYPYDIPIAMTKNILQGIQPANLKHLWLMDVKKEGNNWHSAGLHGKLGYVTARGMTTETQPGYIEALRRIMRTIKNLNIRDLQYRDDIGRRTEPMIKTLMQYGWMR